MPNAKELTAQFQQFRYNLYNCFKHRQDTLIDLLDSITSNSNARSTAELSLNPLFRRNYSALYKAVENFFQPSSVNRAFQEQQELEKQRLLR